MEFLIVLAAIVFQSNASAYVSREIEFSFHDETLLLSGQTQSSKLWRSEGLNYDGSAVPLIIFMHGIIQDLKKYHWLNEDVSLLGYDARNFVSDVVNSHQVAPLVIAVPSQTADSGNPEGLFLKFDFDAFVEAVEHQLLPYQRVDRTHIIIVGHSAGACYQEDSAFASLQAKTFHPYALLAIEGCMSEASAEYLAKTLYAQHVIVSYVPEAWLDRPLQEFRSIWYKTLETHWPLGTRALERYGNSGVNAHLEIVEVVMRRWLPLLLPRINSVHASTWELIFKTWEFYF